MNIVAQGDQLEITFTGAEQVWSLRHKIVIPKQLIARITWHDEFTSEDFGSLWRTGGTGAPGILFAGYFRGGGQRQFLYIKHPHGFIHAKAENVLSIETAGDFPQSRILLTLDKAEADRIIAWFRSR